MTNASPLTFIRLHVFGLRKNEIASILGATPMAWSRWESGQRTSPIEKLRPILAAAAASRGLPWSDSWLFEVPACNSCVGIDQCGQGCSRIIAACAAIRDGDREGGLALAAGCFGLLHGVAPLASYEREMNDQDNGKAGVPIPASHIVEAHDAQAA